MEMTREIPSLLLQQPSYPQYFHPFVVYLRMVPGLYLSGAACMTTVRARGALSSAGGGHDSRFIPQVRHTPTLSVLWPLAHHTTFKSPGASAGGRSGVEGPGGEGGRMWGLTSATSYIPNLDGTYHYQGGGSLEDRVQRNMGEMLQRR